MSYKLGYKFLLLMLLSMLPILSHSQPADAKRTCNTTWGGGTSKIVGSTGNVTKVVMSASITLNGNAVGCSIQPTAVNTLIGGPSRGEPVTITNNGMTVDFSKTTITLTNNINPLVCGFSGNGKTTINFGNVTGTTGCNGVVAQFDVVYFLEGKSTATANNVVFFNPKLTSFADNREITSHSTKTFSTVNVPVSTAPTCSTTIDPSNLILSNIKPTELPGAVGTFTTAGEKTFNLSVTCPPNALAIASNLIPTFQFTRELRVGSFSISRTALATDDLGFGFRVLAPDGNAVRHNAPITSAVYGFNTPTQSQSISKTFKVQYAKTLATITPGAAATSITILIGFQ